MPKTVLNFSLESTNESITPRAGSILLGEYLHAIGLPELIEHHLPQPRSAKGYRPSFFLQPLLLMLHNGGRVLEDLRMIGEDQALRKLLNLEKVPKADSVGKWLKRHGLLGVYAMQRAQRFLLKRYLQGRRELTLDIDASLIFNRKSIAEPTYKGEPGFSSMLGHIDGGWLLHSELRSGKIPPADNNLSFLKRCQAQLPAGVRLHYLRADAAGYQHELFDYCTDEGIIFTVGGKLDASVLEAITQIPEEAWEKFSSYEGDSHHIKEEIAEFVHTMIGGQYAFRMIVVRKRVTPVLPEIWDLLSEEEKLALSEDRYQLVATNADPEEFSPRKVVSFYRKRGNESENRIKEFKNGFNLSYLPTSDFMANAFYFQIGALAYNTFLLFKQEALQESWHKHTVHTIRYKLYHIAGKVVTHARKLVLKVPKLFEELLSSIRQKSYEVSLQ